MQLALIDLDGVVADNTKRMEVAETKREFYRQHLGDCMPDALANPINHAYVQKGFDDLLENLFWQTAFNPDLVRLDTLIDRADKAVEMLESYGYTVVFLTSRPESMREATQEWLFQKTVWGACDLPSFFNRKLVMKAPAFQFVKTPVWKAGIVQTLASLYDADIVKFIDDSEENWNELLKHTPYLNYSLEWISSLKQAVEAIAE